MKPKQFLIVLFVATFLACLAAKPVHGQKKMDTRKSFFIREAGGDTAEIAKLIRIGNTLRNNTDSALVVADKIISLSQALDYDYGIGAGYHRRGLAYWGKQEYRKSNEAFEEAIDYLMKAGAPAFAAECYKSYGINYRFLSEYGKAKETLNKGLKIFEDMGEQEDALKEQLRINGMAKLYYFLWTVEYVQNRLQAGMPYLNAIKNLRDESGIVDGNLYNTFGIVFMQMGEIDSAIAYLEEGVPHAIDQDRLDLQALLYMNLGGAYTEINQLEKAEDYALKAKEIAEQLGRIYYQSQVQMTLGKINEQRGNNPTALEHHIKALDLVRKDSPRHYIIDALVNLGGFYMRIDDPDNALQSFEEARDLAEEMNNDQKLSIALKEIGDVYQIKGDRENALLQYNRSIALNRGLNDNRLLNADVYLSKAEMYRSLQRTNADYDSALTLYRSALTVFTTDSLLQKEANGRIGLGELYLNNNQPDMAVGELAKAVAISRSIRNKVEWYKAHQLLSYAYEANGDFENALHSSRAFQSLKDSVTNVEVLNQLNEIQEKYESGKKDVTIALQEQTIARKTRQVNLSIAIGMLIIVALFLLGALIFQRFQSRKKLDQQRMLYEERSRISSDLHDDISSTLSSVSMLSSFAGDKIKENDVREAEKLLEEISSSSLQMGEELNDLIWTLNPRKDNISELVDRLRNYASPMASARHIQLSFDIDEKICAQHLPLEARKNIYLIMKEAINNAIKYSGCRELVVRLKEHTGKLIFLVKDDGSGFDPNSLNGEGNGLYNMKERAASINAKIRIESSLEQGTEIFTELLS